MANNILAGIPDAELSAAGLGRFSPQRTGSVTENTTVSTLGHQTYNEEAEIASGPSLGSAEPVETEDAPSEPNNSLNCIEEAHDKAITSSSDNLEEIVSLEPTDAEAVPGLFLTPAHAAKLKMLAREVVAARGYRSEVGGSGLANMGFPASWAKRLPALVIPIYNVHGEVAFHQIRPDQPRYTPEGKIVKYEFPKGTKMGLDINPLVRPILGDPSVPLNFTESAIKADALTSRGCPCVGIVGVWNWRGTNDAGGLVALPDFESIAFKSKAGKPRQMRIIFDSDCASNPNVKAALERLKRFLEARGARVTIVYLPPGANGEKVGVDDFFANGGTLEELDRLAAQSQQSDNEPPKPAPLSPAQLRAEFKKGCREIAEPLSLDEVKAVFRRHLYIQDGAIIEFLLAVVVANLLDGDPVWPMIIGRSSGGKTEMISAFNQLPFTREVSTITESALLSGVSKKEHAPGAKGGFCSPKWVLSASCCSRISPRFCPLKRTRQHNCWRPGARFTMAAGRVASAPMAGKS